MRWRTILYLFGLTTILILGMAEPARAEDHFSLTLELGNNLIRLEDWVDASFGKAVLAAPVDYQQVQGLTLAGLEVPLSDWLSGQWGLSAQAAVWCAGSGETFLFWQNAMEDGRLPAVTEIYDLALAGEEYWRLGVFWRGSLIGTDNFRGALRAEIFICPSYLRFDASGQGSLYPSSDGDQGADINGSYRYAQAAGGSPGWGAGLALDVSGRLGTRIDFYLVVENLATLVYFPRLSQENGLAQGEDLPIGSGGGSGGWLSGIVDEGSAWTTLPVIIRAGCTRPFLAGRAGISLVSIDETYDLWMYYAQPIGGEADLMIGYDPVMKGLKFGLSRQGTSLILLVDRGMLGLTLSVH